MDTEETSEETAEVVETVARLDVVRGDLVAALAAVKYGGGGGSIPIPGHVLITAGPGPELGAGAGGLYVTLTGTDLESSTAARLPVRLLMPWGAAFTLSRAALAAAARAAPKGAQLIIEVTRTTAAGGADLADLADTAAAAPAVVDLGALAVGDMEMAAAAADRARRGTLAAFISWPELGAGARVPVPCGEAADFPIIPLAPLALGAAGAAALYFPATALGAGVISGIYSAVGFCASTEDDRHFLTGINFDGKEVAATDGRRLGVMPFIFDSALPVEHPAVGDAPAWEQKSYIIPSATLSRAAKLIRGACYLSFARDGNSVAFEAAAADGSTAIISRLIDGNFPAYHQVMPAAFSHCAAVRPDVLRSALAVCVDMKSDSAAAVRLDFAGDVLVVSHKDNKIMELEILNGTVGAADKPLSLSFNPKYLAAVLRAPGARRGDGNVGGRGDLVYIQFNSGASPVGLSYQANPAADTIQYIVMPLRTK